MGKQRQVVWMEYAYPAYDRMRGGVNTSTSGITTSPSDWSTSDRSFSLVKNEDDSAINRFSSDN